MREQAREDKSDDAFKALSAHNARSRARQERARRRRRRTRRAALLGAAALVLLLIWLNVALWSGSLHVRFVPAKVSRTNASRQLQASTPNRSAPASVQAPAAPQPGANRSSAHPRSAPLLTFRIRGLRGDSWVLIRPRTKDGRVLYSGIVREGSSQL